MTMSFAVVLAASMLLPGSALEKEQRVLKFPSRFSMGNLYRVNAIPPFDSNPKGYPFGEARYVVKIPRGMLIKFEPNGNFYRHPELILSLPHDAFDLMRIRFTSMDVSEERMCDQSLSYLHHFSTLKIIDCDCSDTSDQGAAFLSAVPSLSVVSFNDTLVRGSCLSQLVACKNLSFIRFGGTAVNNSDFRYLKQFPKLGRLGCKRAGLNNAGVEHIGNCPNLFNLDIAENPNVDDRAIPHLLKLKKLQDLNLYHTGISAKGVLQLARLGKLTIQLPKDLNQYTQKEKQDFAKSFIFHGPEVKTDRLKYHDFF